MSINFKDELSHSNPTYSIVDISNIRGGNRSIATFSNAALSLEFSALPDRPKQNYSTLIDRSTGDLYYLSGLTASQTSSWSIVTSQGSGLLGSGSLNRITKWTGTASVGNSSITDDGNTVSINANLTVLGTASTSAISITGSASNNYILKSDATGNASWVNAASVAGAMTGLSNGGLLTINTDASKFNVAAGFGYIVNGSSYPGDPTTKKVSWDEKLANSIPNISTHDLTYVSIDILGDLFFSINPLSATQRRNYIRLGVLIHLNNSTVTYIDNQPTINIEIGGQVQDILEALGFRSLDGNRILPVGTNLKIKKEQGRVFKSGANFRNLITQPHSFILPAQDPITFRYRTQTGSEGIDITDLNPAIYEVNGVITTMPSTATFASIQRIYIFQDGVIRIQPGQRFFTSLTIAVTAINSDIFVTDDDISNNGLYLGAVVLTRNAVALNDVIQAIFVPSLGTTTNGSVPSAPLGYTPEDVANKQNSLVLDATNSNYTTVTAVRTIAGGVSAGNVPLSNGGPSFVYSAIYSDGFKAAIGQPFYTAGYIFDVNGATRINGNVFSLGNGIFNGNVTANSFVVTGGSASQFLKANGTLDSNTYASLVGGLIPSSQLPSYVDDILEFSNLASFPATGEAGKIYIAISPQNAQYRWTGSAYIQITNGLIASTNDVPEGGTNLYFLQSRVLSTTLTGLSTASSTAIISTDSNLIAFGKLQSQINGRAPSSGSSNYIQNGTVQQTANLNISGTGTFGSSVTATAFFQSSDKRLKDIYKRDGDVAYFKWKDGRDDLMHIGYIAQEVKKEYADQVKKGNDKMLSVNYTEVLVSKIQDLTKRIEQLENKNK
jgi:hypothetical protein